MSTNRIGMHCALRNADLCPDFCLIIKQSRAGRGGRRGGGREATSLMLVKQIISPRFAVWCRRTKREPPKAVYLARLVVVPAALLL